MRFTVRLPESLNKKLKKIAQLKGYSRNDVMISACWDLVRSQKEANEDERNKKRAERISSNKK